MIGCINLTDKARAYLKGNAIQSQHQIPRFKSKLLVTAKVTYYVTITK